MHASTFIIDNALPDIEYRTDAPVETVVPRVVTRDGIPMVYIHKERDGANRGFVPIDTFLVRLARREPGLAATGYRSNGRQTTISCWRASKIDQLTEGFLVQN